MTCWSIQFHDPAIFVILRPDYYHGVFTVFTPERAINNYITVGIAFGVLFQLFRIIFDISWNIFYAGNVSRYNTVNRIFLGIKNERLGSCLGTAYFFTVV